jgi:hypothetical protein
VVRSPLPQQRQAARTQRTRWEHGHLKTLCSQTPKLLQLAWARRRLDLLLLALDLAIPPLSLLVLTLTGLLALAALAAASGWSDWTAARLLAVGALALASAIGVGWWRHCREVVPARALVTAPFYALAKLPIYRAFLWRRQQEWVRTEREAATSVVR